MTYFPAVQYHRRQGLNCCVRDGNRCLPLPVVTDKSTGRLSATGEVPDVEATSLLQAPSARGCPAADPEGSPRRLVGATKPLTVSTAQLRTFLPVHLRPINRVVYPGSLGPKT